MSLALLLFAGLYGRRRGRRPRHLQGLAAPWAISGSPEKPPVWMHGALLCRCSGDPVDDPHAQP
eukprot:5377483-Lingulodinium_polyedra.AAC.1